MAEYIINVSEIEDLQTISNVGELNRILARAQSTVVQGGTVFLVRTETGGAVHKFDEITTEEDLENYKQTIFKYM